MDDKILESIKGKVSEDEFKAVLDVKNRNIIALGTDQIFALRDNDGEIRAFKQRVRLTKRDGTLIQPVPGGPWVVSAQGYEVLGEAAGVSAIFPSEVVVDGEAKRNPYVLRDPNNGRVLAVYSRAVAYRFSSKGLPQVCDWTSAFDLPTYRLIDLIAKSEGAPTIFKLLPIEMAPPETADGAAWAKYEFDKATNLWINVTHPGALAWYKQILNREKKAVDFSQTFARRNAVKHLLGIQKSPCKPKDDDPTWDVTILCWRPTSGNLVKWDYTKYVVEVRDKIERVAAGGAFKSDDRLEIIKGHDEPAETPAEEVDLEDVIDVDHKDVVPEIIPDVEKAPAPAPEPPKAPKPADPPKPMQAHSPSKGEPGYRAPVAPPKPAAPPKAPEPPKPPANGLTREQAATARGLEMSKTAFPDAYKKALIKLGLEEPLDPDEMKSVEQTINRILDEENLG